MVASLALVASPANAQNRFEIAGTFGYTFSEGLEVERATFEDGFIDEIATPSDAAVGGSVNFWLDQRIQLGLQIDRQATTLEVDGSSRQEVTSMTIFNYHAVATFHGGTSSSTVRPFAMIGLGATQYQLDDLADTSFEGDVRFSGTLGAGVKAYLTERVGLMFIGRWTPTYITSSPEGFYCSPYWPGGCVVTEDPHYANQLQLAGGIILRL